MKLRFLAPASRDLDDIAKYIAARNPDAARAVVRRILQQIQKLKTIPYLGRPGSKLGTRVLVVPRLPYLVVYETAEREIVVLGVMHGARDWQNDPRFQ